MRVILTHGNRPGIVFAIQRRCEHDWLQEHDGFILCRKCGKAHRWNKRRYFAGAKPTREINLER